jgi:hypothetical protein
MTLSAGGGHNAGSGNGCFPVVAVANIDDLREFVKTAPEQLVEFRLDRFERNPSADIGRDRHLTLAIIDELNAIAEARGMRRRPPFADEPQLLMHEHAPVRHDVRFAWAWFDLHIQWKDASAAMVDILPVSVVKLLAERLHERQFLFALPALWIGLVACQKAAEQGAAPESLHSFLQRPQTHAMALELGVNLKECIVPGTRAKRQLPEDVVATLPLSSCVFTTAVGTIDSVMAICGIKLRQPSRKPLQQKAVMCVIEQLCAATPDITLDLPHIGSVAVKHGRVSCQHVEVAISIAGHNAGTPFEPFGAPRLTSDGTVRLSWLLLALCRKCGRREQALMPRASDAASALISQWARHLDETLASHLHTRPPTCRFSDQALEVLRKSMHTDATRSTFVPRLLAKNQGFAATADANLAEVVYKGNTFKYFKQVSIRAAAASHAMVAIETMRTRASNCTLPVVGDVLCSDASRVACREVMLAFLCAHGVTMVLPLQILPDQHALLDRRAATNRASAIIEGRVPKSQRRTSEREATQSLCTAQIHTLLSTMPFDSMRPYMATSGPPPSDSHLQRRRNSATGCCYWFDPTSKKSGWYLSAELRHASSEPVRILVLCCDEASSNFTMFQFLANHCRLRIFFIRDVPHRLSNVYCNAIRSTRHAFRAISDIVLVHKFRRAPFGGGKFWRQMKEALEMLLDAHDQGETADDLIDIFGESVVADYGDATGAMATDLGYVKALMRKMLNSPMGPKVEVRRWFTLDSAGCAH